jgi:CubicO group peptidase (beta-lactamase class C family)
MTLPQRFRCVNFLWLLTKLLATCFAISVSTAVPANQSDKIDTYLASRIAEQRIPGVALGIVDHDHITHLAGFGVADPSGRPVTPETPFILGSVSKSFTALAVMQLVEMGQINLDAKVRDYIPWFTLADESSQQATVRQLLNHASGLSVETSEKFAASSDVSDDALENRVRDLRTEHLPMPLKRRRKSMAWPLGTFTGSFSHGQQNCRSTVEVSLRGTLFRRQRICLIF